ncbi:MAG TPA: DUF5723 family protein [Saprospiraceae bacterium]|nr:DUF5723 family protein [Saprospiraceae bacterium]HMQ82965.1 DUF5723 family protein [Saprospiraceae bacterium]
MKINKITSFSLLVFLSLSQLQAQEDLSTYFLTHSWQANRANPAFYPDYKLVIGLPGVYNDLFVSNITYNDLIDQNGEVDIDAAIAKMGADNQIRESLHLETISLGLRLGKLSLSFGHSLRFNASMDYPKTLPQLIWQGNAQFIGQQVEFAPAIDLWGVHEFALGAGVELLSGLTVGGRVKWLSGEAAVVTATDQQRLSLDTDPQIYQLTLDADYKVNASNSLVYNGLDELKLNFDFGNFNASQLFSKNSGLAFDLGIHFRSEKLELSASALDIGGQVDWTEEVRNYEIKGNYEFDGLEFAAEILEDSSDFGSVLDTIEARFPITETFNDFSTSFPTRYYLGGQYHLNDTWRFGALLYMENDQKETQLSTAVSANVLLGNAFNLGATYALRADRADNLGLNVAVKLGPIQLVAATDNIITAIQPRNSHSANVRLGLNLLFGKIEKDE